MFTASGRLQGVSKTGGGGGIPGDPYYNNVSLLMHMDGLNNSTAFTDQKGHTITRNGLPVISTAQSQYGGASAYFPGGGTTYLETNMDTAFDLSSGNWTIELWFYVVGFGSNGLTHLIGSANSFTGVGGWGIRLSASEIALVGNNNSQGNYATTVTTGVWHNVTVVRNGTGANSVQLYFNGVALTGTGNNAGDAQFAATNGPVYIGQHPGSAQTYLNGYVDEVRVTKGVARYTANFTPTGPFPDVSSDPFFANVTLLAHMTGANGSTTYTDVKGHTMTRMNNPVITNAIQLFGQNSSYSAASTDSIYATADSGFEFPGEYTVEGFVYLSAYPADYVSILGNLTANGADQWVFECGTGGQFWCYTSGATGANQIVGGGGTLSLGAWHHFAIARDNTNTIRMFVDGVSVGSKVVAGTLGSAVLNMYLGGRTTIPGTSNGVYMREVRVTKGICRYTGTFAPPTGPFPDN